MFPFDPPENIRKPKVFWCFQGDQKGTLGRKGLTVKYFANNTALIRHSDKFLLYTCIYTN